MPTKFIRATLDVAHLTVIPAPSQQNFMLHGCDPMVGSVTFIVTPEQLMKLLEDGVTQLQRATDTFDDQRHLDALASWAEKHNG